MQIPEMVAHGWRFQLVDHDLIIKAEDDPQNRLELGAEAAFSLLDYLYQYRESLSQTIEEIVDERYKDLHEGVEREVEIPEVHEET